MKSEMFSWIRYIFCLLDIYTLYRFFRAMFEVKARKKKVMLYLFFAALCIFATNMYGNTVVNLMVSPIITFLFVWLVYRISMVNGIIYSIIFFAIFAGGEVVGVIFVQFLSIYLPMSAEPWYRTDGIYFLWFLYAFRFAELFLIEKFVKKLGIEKRNDYAWYLLILPVSSIVILSSFLYMDFPAQTFLQILMCVAAFLVHFSNIFIFLILAKVTSLIQKERDEELHSMKQTMEGKQIERVSRLNEKYRNYMHDIHNYFGNIRMLALKGETQKIVHIINAVEGELQEDIGGTFYCGNEVLNAILEDKKIKAEKVDIDFQIQIERFLNLDFLSEADTVSLFGNLLDNAIEAAARCEETNRIVKFRIYMGNTYMLVADIENTFCIQAKREGESLVSTKREEGIHGLGMNIVKKLAEKYGGSLEWEEEENIFRCILSLSNMYR